MNNLKEKIREKVLKMLMTKLHNWRTDSDEWIVDLAIEETAKEIFAEIEKLWACRETGKIITEKNWTIEDHNEACCEAVINYTNFEELKRKFLK